MKPYYRKRWFKLFTTLLVLSLMFVTFLPNAVRYGIEKWLLKQGVDSASVKDVDLNLFTGKLLIKDIRVIKEKREVLNLSRSTADFDWFPLFKRRAFFPQITIDGLTTTIQQLKDGSLYIGGIQLPQASAATSEVTPSEPWGFGLQAIAIHNVHLQVKTPLQAADFTINSINLDKLESWSTQDSHFDFSGTINNSEVASSATLRPFAEQPVFTGKIQVKDLNLAPLAIHLKEQLQELKGLLSLNTEFNIKHEPGKGLHIQTQSTLGLNNLLVKPAGKQISFDKLRWQGKTNVQLSDQQTLLAYLLQGNISSENVSVTPDTQHHYHHDNLNWDGTVTSADKAGSLPQVNGNIEANGITLLHLASNMELFHSDTMTIQGLDVKSTEQISSQKIILQEIRTLATTHSDNKQKKPALLQAKSIEVAASSFTDGKRIKLGDTRIEGALISIDRQKDGQLQQLAVLKSNAPPESQPKEQDKGVSQKEAPLQFSVDQFSLGANSRIHIVDATVTPVFKTELLLKKASISHIDSASPNKPSPYVIDANLDKYSSLHFDGELLPFSSPLSLKVNGKIVNVSLPPVSSYTSSLIGYDLRSGQLSAEITANIVKGKLDVSNTLTLSNLEVKSSDAKKSESLTSQLSMPLNSALSLLRDKNNDIKLSIPVSGNINKPDFDISGVINKAIGTAMKQASLTYLSQALQPYGSLITLAKLAKTAADYVSLNPIIFAPASSLADNNALAYSAKIASLMQERPNLRIKLCGFATSQDSQVLSQQKMDVWKQKQAAANSKAKPPKFTTTDEELLDLALQRSTAIKDILINEHKIAAARLFQCQPSIDRDKDSKPRIDLRI